MTETYTAEQRAIMQLQLKLGAAEERIVELENTDTQKQIRGLKRRC